MPRYEFVEGTSSKFWEITLDGASFTVHFGKIGTKGQTSSKDFPSAGAAKKEYEKLVAEKTKKGYVLVGGDGGDGDGDDDGSDTPAASNPALEEAIFAAPDDVAPYLVYADWLTEKGDPRGQLIALHARGETAKAKAFIDQHAAHFYGALADAIGSTVSEVEWTYGFISAARIAVGYDEEGAVHELCAALLAHPSGRFVRQLTFGITEQAQDGENGYDSVLAAIAEARPRALRTLFVGDFEYPDETEISWSHMGNVGPLWKAVPTLESVILQSGTMELGTIDAPALRTFEARTGGFNAANLTAVCTATWPKLEKLCVWFGDDNYGAEGGVDEIGAILAGQGLPRLTHLGLMNAQFTDALPAALATSKILPRLTHLDLSMGTMTDEGARALAAHAAAFAHLKTLDVSDNFLGEDARQLLAGIPGIDFGTQRQASRYDDEDHRYVSVGE